MIKLVKIGQKEVHPIGFGTWTTGDHSEDSAKEIKTIRTGLDLGMQVIDTAEMYGDGKAESIVAEAIAPYQREDIFLISKVHPANASKNQLPISLEQSLKRLKTDYLDQYLLHWLGDIPLEETIDALEKQRQLGKIKSWGVSNLDLDELRKVVNFQNGKNCESNQVRYNLGNRGIEYDLLPWMQENKIPLIAYAPIAKGDSLGNHFLQQKVLQEIADKYRCTIFQLLLAWCIRDEKTIAIPQTSNEAHVVENMNAVKIKLTSDDLKKIEEMYPNPKSKQPLALW